MSHSLKNGAIIGKYKLENKIWKGTYGETWLAKDTNYVAMQFLTDREVLDLVENTFDDSPIHYPHIAKLREWDKVNHALIWEYISGRRLYTFIQQLKQIKMNIAVFIARKMLEILTFTANKALIHGAVRPSHIIVTRDKRIKLTNFGLGRIEQQLIYQHYQRGSKKYEALFPYFAPEVLEDMLFDDAKNDIYSVGIVLAEMLIGKKLENGEIPQQLEEKKIPKKLIPIVLKAIADFEERYNHPNEMHYDLTRLLKSTEHLDKIYVAPPQVQMKNIALEAVPADSEEVRIYQEEQIAAKQTIDAGVVDAEPADYMEESESQNIITEEEAKKEIKRILRQTGRMEADSVVMIATFDEKILAPLDKTPIWPTVFTRYLIGAGSIFLMLFIGAYFLDFGSQNNSLSWILLPFYISGSHATIIETMLHLILFSVCFAFFVIPFWDRRGKFALNHFFIPFLATFLAGILGLNLWRQGKTAGELGGGVIILIFGILLGVAFPYVSRIAREQGGHELSGE